MFPNRNHNNTAAQETFLIIINVENIIIFM